MNAKNAIKLHTASDVEGMRAAGRLAAEVLDMIAEHVKPGVTTLELDQLCHDMIISRGAVPAPLGYRGYPKSICTSVNQVVCHGIPTEKKLENGDILNIDVTVILDGWHGDTSRMYWAGEPKPFAKKLCEVTYEAMMRGIKQVKPGNTLLEIGKAIQTYAESQTPKYSVVRDYCGHGLGKIFHDAPNILHYVDHERNEYQGQVLKPGMFFTVEPMINMGTFDTKLDRKDGWTVTTKDGRLSAQFEHSVGVTASGVEIFTESPKGWHFPPYPV